MPKQKTHSGAKDRFRITRKGKVLHGRQNRKHLLEAIRQVSDREGDSAEVRLRS